ncbi:MAG TPA: OsmC family protein [Solirubrobacteraceae bacterium]|nr:OsmC family protein [Solirubrobacteraceae bacterium]
MKATARRTGTFTHDIDVRNHRVVIDEPRNEGGDDDGPSPQEMLAASLASCTAVTMEMYAKHKGWNIGTIEVECDYTPAERGCPTKFNLVLRLPRGLSDDQIRRLKVIAAKCPVHRALDGEVMFNERLELVEPAPV